MRLIKRLLAIALTGTLITSVAYADIDGNFKEGLTATYDFDTEGLAEDTSGNGNNGVIKNVQWQNGTYLFQKGEGSSIDIGTKLSAQLAGSEAVTVSAWFKHDGAPSNSYYILNIPLDSGKVGIEMFINATSFRLAGRSNSADAWMNKKYPFPEAGRWNHAVGIWDFKNKEIRCFINGVEQKHDGGNEKAAFTADKYTPASPNSATISRSASQSEFNGNLDEIKIYNRRLTMDEILKLGSTKELDTSLTNKEITDVLTQKLENTVVLGLDSSDAFVNKKRVKIDNTNFDVMPILESDRTLVPLRFISESFGAQVSYDDKQGKASITADTINIEVTTGQRVLYKNGSAISLDIAPVIYNGRMLLPLRAVTEAMGKEVLYHDGLIIISENTIFDLSNKDDTDCVTELKNRLINLNYIPPVRNHKNTMKVVAYSDPATSIYIASPSIIKLSNGILLASHDFNGPKNTMTEVIYRSDNDGETWKKVSEVHPCTWATLFEHKNSVYLMGTSEVFGDVIIYKSDDFGSTWTTATDSKTGILIKGGNGPSKTPPNFHTAPVTMVKHNGRIYRAFEDGATGTSVSQLESFVMSAPENSDLLDASSWTVSNRVKFNPNVIPADWNIVKSSAGWLEGNVVVAPNGEIWNILRTTTPPASDKAAILKLSDDNKTLNQDLSDAIINMPGASHKFVIRYDEKSKKYVTIVNENSDVESFNQRNILSLAYSEDLKNWDVAETLIADDSILSWGESIGKIGYQYVDFVIDDDDIKMLVRQSTDGGANYHDANHITYYEISDFRAYFK